MEDIHWPKFCTTIFLMCHYKDFIKGKCRPRVGLLYLLIEYNMRNIFFEKFYTRYGRENSSKPFSEKINFSISMDRKSKVLYSLFLLYAKLRVIKYIETKLKTTCFYLILSFFKKQKEVWK